MSNDPTIEVLPQRPSQVETQRPTLRVSGRGGSATDLISAPWQEAVDSRTEPTSFFHGSQNVNASGKFTKVDGNVHYHYYNTTYHVVQYGSNAQGSGSHPQARPKAYPTPKDPRAQIDDDGILSDDGASYSRMDGLKLDIQDPVWEGYPPESHIRAPTIHSSKSEPLPQRVLQSARRASCEALTPIDQPQMSTYARHGNHSQPELSVSARSSLAQSRLDAGKSQQPRTRKRIDLSARQVPQVSPPATHRPNNDDFFISHGGKRHVNHEYLKIHFLREGRLKESQALYILEQATNMFSREPNMVTVKSPVTVCGDIHGQYYDLMQIFEVGGSLEDSIYLFLGNYVDQGCFGIESILYLYALKLWSPSRIILLRGNHECRQVTEFFNFKRECIHKYSESVYEACLRSFYALPVAALVDDKIFCVHGGISPQLMTLNHLATINRFTEPNSHGLLCDLLWSDPSPNYDREAATPETSSTSPESEIPFLHNANRGQGFFYTYEAVCQFLDRNRLYTMIRGHEVQKAGYNMHRETPKRDFPSVITMFSAPNYLDKYPNHGAILHYGDKCTTIKQYNSSPHPYWLPDFIDAFAWSLPFIGAQFRDMATAMLNVCSEQELARQDSENRDDSDIAQELRPLAARRGIIKKKILAVGRIMIVFQLLRDDSEKALESRNGVAASEKVNPPTPASIYRMNGTYSSTKSAKRSSTQASFPVTRDSSRRSSTPQTQRNISRSTSLSDISGILVDGPHNSNQDPEGFSARKSIIKAKMLAVGKWQRMLKSLRDDPVKDSKPPKVSRLDRWLNLSKTRTRSKDAR